MDRTYLIDVLGVPSNSILSRHASFLKTTPNTGEWNWNQPVEIVEM